MALDCDVLVVGCGIAGTSAAVSAMQQGARVRVLERSPIDERGGNSRYTGGNLRMKSDTEVTDDLAELLVQTSELFVHHSLKELTLKPYAEWPPVLRAYGFADPGLVAAFVDNAPGAVAWMRDCGVRLASSVNPASGVPCLETVGGGEAAVETLAQAAETGGVQFHYETAGRALIVDDDGSVIGVRARSRAEGQVTFSCSSVILAAGGFEGNLEMATRYLGPDAYRLRPVCRGGMYNKGEGIRMALDIGAAPAGQYDGFHAMICDPRSRHTESIKPWNYGILVNNQGHRFVDEGSDSRARISDQIGRAILHQPDGRAFFVYDEKLESIPHFRRQIGSEHDPFTASSIEDLATLIGVNPTNLRNTIDSFNAAVQPGEFTPVVPDGKCTKGIVPPRSNWARPIDGPTFMAYPLECTNVFTFGGLRVSPTAQVVDNEGDEIPGLYAAGEIVGLYYGLYSSATSYLRGLVFGRLAGLNAARASVPAGPPTTKIAEHKVSNA